MADYTGQDADSAIPDLDETLSGDAPNQQTANQQFTEEIRKKLDASDLGLDALNDTVDKPDSGNGIPFLAPDAIQNYAPIEVDLTDADFIRYEKLTEQEFSFAVGYTGLVAWTDFYLFGPSFSQTSPTTITANAAGAFDLELTVTVQAVNTSGAFPAECRRRDPGQRHICRERIGVPHQY